MERLKFLAGIIAFALFLIPSSVSAGWVNGYWSKGQYVNGYWRSDPNGLKYDNYSFDGDWSDAFNDSYYAPTKNYSAEWYTPAWITQNDYYIGKSFYDTRNSYKSYDHNFSNYDYDYLDDPIYKYTPSYNYGYSASDISGSSRNSYKPYSSSYTSSLNNYKNSYNSYSGSYSNGSSYNSYSPYNNYSSSYKNYGSSLYNSGSLFEDDYTEDCYLLC